MRAPPRRAARSSWPPPPGPCHLPLETLDSRPSCAPVGAVLSVLPSARDKHALTLPCLGRPRASHLRISPV